MKKRINFIFGICFIVVLALVYFKLSYKYVDRQLGVEQFDLENKSSEGVVIKYLIKNNKLPDYYVTKQVAYLNGWKPSKFNLCDVLPGKIIGGDIFKNREKKLPDSAQRIWKEADINYKCYDKRGGDRLLYSNDGFIYVTYDHYKTFIKRR